MDAGGKCHPSDAYDWSLETFRRRGMGRDLYPKVVARLRTGGLDFEVRLRSEKLRYVKTDVEGNHLRDARGNLIDLTDEEIAALGKRTDESSVAVFHGPDQVAALEDEWGCVLVVVAREYRRFGLGAYLHRLARTLYPAKPSGGFTPQGRASFARVHRWFVRNALARGFYRERVRAGSLTMERVREIIASGQGGGEAGGQREAPPVESPAEKWLLYGADDTFIVYDPILKDLIADGWDRNRHWIERAVKAAVHVLVFDDGRGWSILSRFGGETPALRRFVLRLAMGEAERGGTTLRLDPEDMADAAGIAEEIGSPDRMT